MYCDFSFGDGTEGAQFVNGGPDGLNDDDVTLVPGQLYYVQIFFQGSRTFGTGEIALQEFAAPPTNDECADDVPELPVNDFGDCVFTSVNTVGATQSTSPSCTGSSNNDDVWYRFVAKSEDVFFSYENFVVTNGFASSGLGYAVYDACGGTELACDFSCGLAYDPRSYLPGGFLFRTEVDAFSEFFLLPANVQLPVELASFPARAEQKANVLEWTAQQEIDFRGYTVERSTDQLNFAAVGIVPGKAEANEAATYTFRDAVDNGTFHYRLRMEDLDGTIEFSNVVTVRRESADFQLAVFPNPATDQVRVNLALPNNYRGPVRVQLVDVAGRAVRDIQAANQRQVEFNVSDLPAGVYVLLAKADETTISQRLIVR